MKLPRSWPKSSLSRSVSGIAAQLIATKARSRRGESAWMAWAKSSLPVPLSPSRSTVASVAATRSASARTSRIAADSPMIDGIERDRASANSSDSRERVRRSMARETSRRSRSGSTGLVMKSSAPRFIASTAVSIEPKAVMTSTGSVGRERLRGVEDGEPVGARKPPVGQDQVEPLARLSAARPPATRRSPARRRKPLGLQHLLEHRAQGVLVLDDQDPGHVLMRG